ncbi:MAG: MFS transporter [Promethearchaeota archaeon]
MNIKEQYNENRRQTKILLETKMNIRKNIKKMYAINFVSSLHFISPVLVLFFTEWGGITLTQVLLLQAWFMGWMFILEIPTGTIADYFGRKISLILSQTIMIAAVLVYSSVPLFSVFLLGEFLFALALTLSSGASEAFIYDTLIDTDQESESDKVFGRIQSASLMGILSGSLLGSLITVLFGVRECFSFMVFPTIIGLFLSLLLKEPMRHEKDKSGQNMMQILKDGIKHIRKNKIVQLLIIDILVISIIAYFIIWLWQTRLQTIGVELGYFGIINFGMLLGQIIWINCTDKIKKVVNSRKSILTITAFLTGTGFLIAGVSSNIFLAILGIIMAATFGLSRRVLLIGYLNKNIPSEQRATIISTAAMLRQFFLMVLNPIVGIFAELYLENMLVILGILAIIWAIISPVKEHHLISETETGTEIESKSESEYES